MKIIHQIVKFQQATKRADGVRKQLTARTEQFKKDAAGSADASQAERIERVYKSDMDTLRDGFASPFRPQLPTPKFR